MEETTISLVLSLVALAIALFSLYHSFKKEIPAPKPADLTIRSLQLQAYERLVILCERISLPALISRANDPRLSTREMQALLSETIKQEFEYNASQQIYVSAAAWNAVQNLKDQTLLIINQIAAALPPDAKATDLNKHALEVIVAQQERALHSIVLEALNSEAKKIMQ